MTSSNGPVSVDPTASGGRVPLRVSLTADAGQDRLDGGWWPQSRDLTVELADLVEHFPAELGRVVGAAVSAPDWDTVEDRITVAGSSVPVRTLPDADAHLVHLERAGRPSLRVLVVPPSFTRAQGAESLLAAATRGNAHSATDLLDTVAEHPDADPDDRWSDGGGSWWAPNPVPPSYRTS
jgi:hypothetical protein